MNTKLLFNVVLVVFVLLMVVFGFILGGATVCGSLDGFYDSQLVCHLNYTPTIQSIEEGFEIYNIKLGVLDLGITSNTTIR